MCEYLLKVFLLFDVDDVVCEFFDDVCVVVMFGVSDEVMV